MIYTDQSGFAKNDTAMSLVYQNYSDAQQLLKQNGKRPQWFVFLWVLCLIISLAADYVLSYDFFRKLAENDLGEVPADLVFMIPFKAMLSLGVALLLKATFYLLPKLVRRFVFYGLFVLLVFVLLNVGAAQINPLIYDQVIREYQPVVETDQFESWLGIGETETGENNLLTDESSDEPDYVKIGRDEFIHSAKWYNKAFLIMSFLGVISLGGISKNQKLIGKLNQAKHVTDRFKEMQAAQQQIILCDGEIQSCKNNQNLLCRLVQESVIQEYLTGLRECEMLVNEEVMGFNSYKDTSSMRSKLFNRNQGFIDVEMTEEKIKLAKQSIKQLVCAHTDYISGLYEGNFERAVVNEEKNVMSYKSGD